MTGTMLLKTNKRGYKVSTRCFNRHHKLCKDKSKICGCYCHIVKKHDIETKMT